MNLQRDYKCRQNISGLKTESQEPSVIIETENMLSVRKEENEENVAISN